MKENVCVNVKNVAVKTENEDNDKEADNYQYKKIKKEEDTIQNMNLIETNMKASAVPMKNDHGKKQKKVSL